MAATSNETLSLTLALQKMTSAYGRLHDMLSDAIKGGRLTEADLPDDYRAIAEQLAGHCNKALEFAEDLLKARVKSRTGVQSDETVVSLTENYTLRSGSDEFMAGDYVRLCGPDGAELEYWHYDEWRDDPQLVMGAIMRSAAGLKINRFPSMGDSLRELAGLSAKAQDPSEEKIMIRFECGQEDRISETYEVDFVQFTYDSEVRTIKGDEEVLVAYFGKDGWWHNEFDGKRYSDIIVG
ncbi:MAG: hypothetical protein M0036_14185 [Desulfobacteraceae bacterium]|nr:hypothetical protein [Desulfobacteraceae bacterium]